MSGEIGESRWRLVIRCTTVTRIIYRYGGHNEVYCGGLNRGRACAGVRRIILAGTASVAGTRDGCRYRRVRIEYSKNVGATNSKDQHTAKGQAIAYHSYVI